MKFSEKIVQTIPLQTIWTNQQEVQARRQSLLTKIDIKNLLKESMVHFVIADIGKTLTWIEPAQCFDFWKSEVINHLADNLDKIELDSYVDNYAYIASQWTEENETPIILLEKVH